MGIVDTGGNLVVEYRQLMLFGVPRPGLTLKGGIAMAFYGLNHALSRTNKNEKKERINVKKSLIAVMCIAIIVLLVPLVNAAIEREISIPFELVAELETFDGQQIPWDVWYVLDSGYEKYTSQYCDLSGIDFDRNNYTYFVSSRYKMSSMTYVYNLELLLGYYLFNEAVLPKTRLIDSGRNEAVYLYRSKNGVLLFHDQSEDSTHGFFDYKSLEGTPLLDCPSIWFDDNGNPIEYH